VKRGSFDSLSKSEEKVGWGEKDRETERHTFMEVFIRLEEKHEA